MRSSLGNWTLGGSGEKPTKVCRDAYVHVCMHVRTHSHTPANGTVPYYVLAKCSTVDLHPKPKCSFS